jgi:hypothetical protein
MVYDLSAVLPLFLVVAALALVGGALSIAVVAQSLARHRRVRVAGRQSIPTYYRRVLLTH